MSGFSADWLALREPFDRRARDVSVMADVARHFSNRASLTIETPLEGGCRAIIRLPFAPDIFAKPS